MADIVSKNGNFLLDIGPKADGAIPDIMQCRSAPGDAISLLGYQGTLNWTKASDGSVVINVPAAARQSGQYAWVFKIDWKH